MSLSEKLITDALRYMKVPPSDNNPGLKEVVSRNFDYLETFMTPRCVFGRFNFKKSESGIEIEGAEFQSKDVLRLTSRSDKCYLLAATLGHETDKKILTAQQKDMLEGLALDSCASVMIDEFIDEFIKNEIRPGLKDGEFLTSRFSPGYGDLSMEASKDIIMILNATKRIGLSVTKSLMMVPIKSVTAIIGLGVKIS
mgnify:CR=1 FL=1